MKRRPQKIWKSKRILILAGLLVALIIFRAFLPSIVTSYVNKTLNTIPFSGRVDDPDADILATIGGLIKNGFIRALQPGIEGSITLQKARAQ